MYSDVILKIMNKEKELKKINTKDSRIKNFLIDECKKCFSEFWNPPEFTDKDVESFEIYTAYKKKIMGNLILIA